MRHFNLFLILSILILSIYLTGCSSQGPSEAVNSTVLKFLKAVDEQDYYLAYSMCECQDFLVPASIDLFFKSKGFSRGRLIGSVIASEMHTDTAAVVMAQCTVETFDENDDDFKQFVYPMVFKLKPTKIGWTINEITFNAPLELSKDNWLVSKPQSDLIDPILEILWL